MKINQILEGDFASQEFNRIIKEECHSLSYDTSNTDEDYEGHKMLADSGAYEFHEEYHDDTVCYLKRVA